MLTLTYQHSQFGTADPYSDTAERWTVSITEPGDDDEDGPHAGELTLYRLRDDTGHSRLMAADSESGELLSIAEAVMDGNDYNEEFQKAIDMPVGDLLVLDRVYLAPAWRGFGLGPIFAAEAIRRLEGGCCAVAVEPGATEWPEDESLVTDEYHATVTRKIAALWETIGFQHFKDGIYLRDTAVDHGGILREQRQHLRTLSEAHRASKATR
ncbi:hypothetical protein F7Q99_37020 [Streptomyces kaniharaensis]|uniref:GNAT family N-acetyltransferase n=1 Tax=Streptomyces kaniharaensis TaxID=212423 RepID=A0A6N7L352_9ACTN|nr:hypothetical protein [Streptomyces kaniharaensis]MQS17645.1 hypothetical protein [Streptomyces kaniharaensis]